MSIVRRAYYFGCQERGVGHRLYGPGAMPFRTAYPDRADFPKEWTIGYLDGGLLEDQCVPDVETGMVIWTCRAELRWLAFAWWDRTGDSRPGSSSGFYVSGFEREQMTEAFEFAKAGFPHVVARQRYPLVVGECR